MTENMEKKEKGLQLVSYNPLLSCGAKGRPNRKVQSVEIRDKV